MILAERQYQFLPNSGIFPFMAEEQVYDSEPQTPRLTANWLKATLKKQRRSQQELADFMKVDHRVVWRMCNDQNRRFTEDEARAIRKFLREDYTYDTEEDVSGGLHDMPLGAPAAPGEVELYGAGSAGQLRLDATGRIGLTRPHPLQQGASRPFAIQAVDDTMSPRYEIGEIAYAVRGKAPLKGQDCIVEMADHTGWLGRFDGISGNTVNIRLIGDANKLKALPRGDVCAVHAVVGRG